jgi:ribosomal protein L31
MHENRQGDTNPAWNGGNITVECSNCGNGLSRTPWEVNNRERFFCDDTCQSEWQSENWQLEGHPTFRQVEFSCHHCGETAKKVRYRYEKHDLSFCNKECHREWLTTRPEEGPVAFGEDHPNYNHIEVFCDWCGNKFKKLESEVERQGHQFCQKGCFYNWLAKHRTEGYGHYGPGFSETKKSEVRERDGHECQDCGMSQEAHIDAHDEKLHVHHIRPAREFDNPEERNAKENLITLCRGCHLGKWEQLAPLRPDTAPLGAD